MNGTAVSSPAKLNLTLHVGARREDGYHEIESLIVPLEFGDLLHITPRDDDRILCTCSDPSIPTDERNLAVRAALQLQQRLAARRGATIAIQKRIPVGAGLGGGSGNAAATLRALNDLWRLELSIDELAQVGARVGSDVPAMVYGRPCVIRGRGERVSLEAPSLAAEVLLVLPSIHCSTAEVYARFDTLPPPQGARDLHELIIAMRAIRASEPETATEAAFDRLHRTLFNDLAAAAQATAPDLAQLASALIRVTGVAFAMSGSGAAHFRLYPPNDAGRDRLQQDSSRITAALSGIRVLATRTLHA